MPATTSLPHPPSLDALRSDGPISVFLDFDGTLVDIAPTPDSIRVPARIADRLAGLANELGGRLALISGRAISDIEGHTGTLAIARAGSHGADMRLPDGSHLAEAPAAIPADVRAELAGFARRHGFSLEEKPHGAALHYRSDPSLEDAGLAFAKEVSDRHGLEIKGGKCVIELVNPGAEKGAAVHAFMDHSLFAGSHPLFIGDDVTDEDGFAAVMAHGGTGILVGDRNPTLAQYRLADPAAVLNWLGIA